MFSKAPNSPQYTAATSAQGTTTMTMHSWSQGAPARAVCFFFLRVDARDFGRACIFVFSTALPAERANRNKWDPQLQRALNGAAAKSLARESSKARLSDYKSSGSDCAAPRPMCHVQSINHVGPARPRVCSSQLPTHHRIVPLGPADSAGEPCGQLAALCSHCRRI